MDRYAQWGFPQQHIDLPKVIRINPLRIQPDVCLGELARLGFVVEPTFLEYAYIVRGGPTIASTLPYLNGWIHIQELSSQIPAHILSPPPNARVLDVAAAPGNKTTQMAVSMNNSGVIVACDPIHERLEKLKANCARLGVANVVAYQIDGAYADELIAGADAVCCDVPCSGNFLQDGWEGRSLDQVMSRTELQKRLLETAVFSAREGGKILYSTCSLEKEENEDIVEWALHDLPVKLLPITLPVGHPGLTPQTKLCRRLWPAQDRVGAFFLAYFERV